MVKAGYREVELGLEVEATYQSVLPLLSELTTDQQAVVVMNWVKYVLTLKADTLAGFHTPLFNALFTALCYDFANGVSELPAMLAEVMAAHHRCGECPVCKAERPTEPAPSDDKAN